MLTHDAQGLGGLAAAVERQRVLPDGAVAFGVLGCEGRQLTGDLGVTTKRQRSLPALLHHVEAVEPEPFDLGLGGLEVGQLAERVAAPELERLTQEAIGREEVTALACCRGFVAQEREAEVLHGLSRRCQAVALGLGHDPRPCAVGNDERRRET